MQVGQPSGQPKEFSPAAAPPATACLSAPDAGPVRLDLPIRPTPWPPPHAWRTGCRRGRQLVAGPTPDRLRRSAGGDLPGTERSEREPQFGWAHVRRDFVGVGKGWPELKAWA